MKKHIILHIISGILIIILLFIGYSWRGDIVSLKRTHRKNEEVIQTQLHELDVSRHQNKMNEDTIKTLEQTVADLTDELRDESYLRFYYATRYDHLYQSSYRRGNLIKILSNELLEYRTDYYIIYDSDDNGEYVEMSYLVDQDRTLSLEGQLSLIAENMMKYSFSGTIIDVVSIDDIDGKLIAHIDLRNPEGYESFWVTNFFMGSSQGSTTADTLIESFLQKEVELDHWIDGIYFSYEGVRDWITDHDPALCRYIYYRDGSSIEDVN